MRDLRRRPWWAHTLIAAAVALLIVCLLASGFAGGNGLAMHMTRHLVLLDLVPVLLLIGIGVDRLPHVPLAAGGITATVLVVVWHLPVVFNLGLEHGSLHLLEHIAFVAAGILLWLPVVSPRTGAAAALAFLFLTRNAQMILGNVLLWMPHPIYDHSGSLHQQRLAAAIMLGEGLAVGLAAAAWPFARLMHGEAAPASSVQGSIVPGTSP